MIAKEYRLTEHEVRKVLSRRKPFFSYMFIANTLSNTTKTGRIGILLSSKVARGSVNRNYWRRTFYDISKQYLHDMPIDIVFVPKKGTTLNYKNASDRIEFVKNIEFIYRIIKNKK